MRNAGRPAHRHPDLFILLRFVHFANPVADSKVGGHSCPAHYQLRGHTDWVMRTTDGDTVHCDYTQWVLIKRFDEQGFHYRSYSDISMHTINLDQLDFSPGAKITSCPISGATFFCDVSNYLK